MPTKSIWIEPDLFMEYASIKVFYTYKHDDIDQGPERYWFTLQPECGLESAGCGDLECSHVFDVQDLSTWQPLPQPPFLTGAHDTPENRAAWERYWLAEPHAIKRAIIDAIEQGELAVRATR